MVQAQDRPGPIPILRLEYLKINFVRNNMNIRALELIGHLPTLYDHSIHYLTQSLTELSHELTNVSPLSALVNRAQHIISMIRYNHWYFSLSTGYHSYIAI